MLTLYERRVAEMDLPFFLSLTEHAAGKGLPVPGPIHDRLGRVLQRLAGRPACLIEFLAGVSTDEPDPDACAAIGRLLARFHEAVVDFPLDRQNGLSLVAGITLGAPWGAGVGA